MTLDKQIRSTRIRIATAIAGIPEQQHSNIVAQRERGGEVRFHKVCDWTELDRLREGFYINAAQHSAGEVLQILYIASRPAVTMRYDSERLEGADDNASALEMLLYVMRRVSRRYTTTVYRVVCENHTPTQADRAIIADALDEVSKAITAMRKQFDD